ncbi:hypothetical protein FSP39_019260 [Pinctada imbricata]|uniref:HORMA domain-containing protein n=1 Tax=Pinctada imbricata TaxID=66713 RepID=A0AA89C0I0_PINIB|nr:hypothetical protein FSP39_019260 [Pinctada imbricata]
MIMKLARNVSHESRFIPIDFGVKRSKVKFIGLEMANLQCQREKTGSWSSIFPNETVTEQQSALFVKKLLAVAISNIAYLRAIFPEHAFGDRCLDDLNLKILRDDSTCPGACHVIKWVKGCFDALDKKYIYVDPDNPDTIIESYTFKFSYAKDGGIDIYRNEKKISSAYSDNETKKATIRLLRTIIVLTQTLSTLPDDVMMTMKLLYYEDVTPADYEPPGFKPADSDKFTFDVEPANINVGDVSTVLRLKTDKQQFDLKEEPIQGQEDVEKQDDVEMEQVNEAEVEFQEDQSVIDTADCKTADENHDKHPNLDAQVPTECPAVPDEEETQRSNASQGTGEEEFGVRCPCGCNEDDGLMVLCAECKFWQHGVCFLILSENDAPSHHICDVCAQPGVEDREPTDPHLCDLSSVAVQATCIWRRALMAATEMKRILAPNLSKRLGVEMNVATGLVNRLEKENYISNAKKGKRLGKIVNKEKILQEGMKKYLTKSKKTNEKDVEKDENVDKLTEMTSNMELNEEAGIKKTKKDSIPAVHEESKSKSKGTKSTDSVKKSRKRAVSKVDWATEFEVSESQDVVYDVQDLTPSEKRRKKKASVVARAIMV